MKCTSPHIAVWYTPDYAVERPFKDGSFGGFFLKRAMDKPYVLSRYHEGYQDLTACGVLGLPETFSNMFTYITLPCGNCLACRLNRSSEWVARNLAELRYHDRSAFITLTVSPEKESEVFPRVNGMLSLDYTPFQLFLKRLRNAVGDVRFFMCGEYGENFERPHFHAIIYGYDFPDKKPWNVHGDYVIYRSEQLEKLWEYGFSTVGTVTEDSIQYVSSYVCKKMNGKNAEKHYQGRMPEFVHMSLKPGIGARFFTEFCGKDFYKIDKKARKLIDDTFSISSRTIKPPRYYDKLFERTHNDDYVQLKRLRAEMHDDLFSVTFAEFLRKEFYMQTVCNNNKLKKGDYNV